MAIRTAGVLECIRTKFRTFGQGQEFKDGYVVSLSRGISIGISASGVSEKYYLGPDVQYFAEADVLGRRFCFYDAVDSLPINIHITHQLGVCPPEIDTLLMALVAGREMSCNVQELGTGSGLISIFLAKRRFKVTSSDVSGQAVDNARKNLSDNQVNDVKVIQSDLFDNITGRYQMVVFNPPARPNQSHLTAAAASVLRQNPILARNLQKLNYLFGGESRMPFIREFLRQCKPYLKKDGIIYMQLHITEINALAGEDFGFSIKYDPALYNPRESGFYFVRFVLNDD